jgi:hypothetical protein
MTSWKAMIHCAACHMCGSLGSEIYFNCQTCTYADTDRDTRHTHTQTHPERDRGTAAPPQSNEAGFHSDNVNRDAIHRCTQTDRLTDTDTRKPTDRPTHLPLRGGTEEERPFVALDHELVGLLPLGDVQPPAIEVERLLHSKVVGVGVVAQTRLHASARVRRALPK